jgi:hypothetical protein
LAGRRPDPAPPHTTPSHRADPAWAVTIAVAIGALGVYRTTLLPGVGVWDTAEAQTVLPLLGTMHPTGFPAYVLLGWLASAVLAPFGSPALRINLLSALLVAGAAGTLVVVVRRLGAGLAVAAAAAVGFALTPIVWQVGVAADVHALHLALLGILVVALLRWASLVDAWRVAPDPAARRRADRALVLAAVVFGVSVANHGLTLLLVPAVGLYVLAVDGSVVRRPRLVAAALGACLGVAALLYLELPLRAGPLRAPLVYGHPETWTGFWNVVLARQFQGGATGLLVDPVGRLAAMIDLVSAQLGPLAILVPVGFLVTVARHPRYALLSGVAAGLTCLFAASYENADIGRYYAGPAFFAWTWLAVLATELIDRVTGPGAAAHGPGMIERGPRTALTLVLAGALLVPTAVGLRDRWQSIDSSRITWPSVWLDEALAAMDRDAVVVSWWSYSTPLWYGTLVEGRRPDIEVIDDRTRLDRSLGSVADVIEVNLARGRPVYVIRATAAEVQALERQYVLAPVAGADTLYRVIGPQETRQ